MAELAAACAALMSSIEIGLQRQVLDFQRQRPDFERQVLDLQRQRPDPERQ
jgi:hypothetical protein